jgi:hypothetical protein
MKYRFFAVLFCIALSFCYSCNNNVEEGGFRLPKKKNTSNSFRIDGYYYIDRDSTLYTFVFYGDGQVIDCSIYWDSKLDFEYYIDNGNLYDFIKGFKRAWGRYLLKDKSISIEFPYDSNNCTNLRTGIILNDTTLFFSKFRNIEYNGIEYLDDTLHFKAFSPKPDSTYIGTN